MCIQEYVCIINREKCLWLGCIKLCIYTCELEWIFTNLWIKYWWYPVFSKLRPSFPWLITTFERSFLCFFFLEKIKTKVFTILARDNTLKSLPIVSMIFKIYVDNYGTAENEQEKFKHLFERNNLFHAFVICLNF